MTPKGPGSVVGNAAKRSPAPSATTGVAGEATGARRIELPVAGVTCPNCVQAVERALRGVDAVLAPARDAQRRAQFFLDFIEAENSIGFHAPQEAARILGEAINFARQGQIALRDRRSAAR